jgi:hypothetical protein
MKLLKSKKGNRKDDDKKNTKSISLYEELSNKLVSRLDKEFKFDDKS